MNGGNDMSSKFVSGDGPNRTMLLQHLNTVYINSNDIFDANIRPNDCLVGDILSISLCQIGAKNVVIPKITMVVKGRMHTVDGLVVCIDATNDTSSSYLEEEIKYAMEQIGKCFKMWELPELFKAWFKQNGY
jgi:hypothetical protein